jgi:DNA polymerase III delta subunit
MTRVNTETEKLICYVGNGAQIKSQDVIDMVSRDMEYKIYELTDYIAKKKFDLALLVVKDMTNKGEPPQRVLSYIYNYFRRLLHVAISDMTAEEIAKAFGIKEFAVRKMKEQSNMFKKKALKSAVDMLTDSDYKIKYGLADGDDRAYLTIFKIMTDR